MRTEEEIREALRLMSETIELTHRMHGGLAGVLANPQVLMEVGMGASFAAILKWVLGEANQQTEALLRSLQEKLERHKGK